MSFAIELLVPAGAGAAPSSSRSGRTGRGPSPASSAATSASSTRRLTATGTAGHRTSPTDAAPAFQRAYCDAAGLCGPTAWALIVARAWVASRALDYVLGDASIPADASRVCIAGHSRNGKQSLVAAAFDDRIAAVVGSSPGSPIASPFRFSSDQYYGQDAITSGAKAEWFSWWAAKSREYVGAEDTMPTDGHAGCWR